MNCQNTKKAMICATKVQSGGSLIIDPQASRAARAARFVERVRM
jgi:hypothetical protein